MHATNEQAAHPQGAALHEYAAQRTPAAVNALLSMFELHVWTSSPDQWFLQVRVCGQQFCGGRAYVRLLSSTLVIESQFKQEGLQ